MKKAIFALFGAAIFLSTGCANRKRLYDEVGKNMVRTPVETQHVVEIGELENTEIDIKVSNHVHEKIKTYESNIHGEVVTPYSLWREIYEVPCGVVLIPVSIVSHILSIVTFDWLPFSASKAVTSTAWTGFNPFLNWESESRSEKRPLISKDSLVEEREEKNVTPMPNVAVIVQSNESRQTLRTDKRGVTKLVLLSISDSESAFKGDRKFEFYVGDETTPSNEILLPRDFVAELLKAQSIIRNYDQEKPSGKKLAECIDKLEELEFSKLAYQLEKRELKKHRSDKAFVNEFREASQSGGKE